MTYCTFALSSHPGGDHVLVAISETGAVSLPRRVIGIRLGNGNECSDYAFGDEELRDLSDYTEGYNDYISKAREVRLALEPYFVEPSDFLEEGYYDLASWTQQDSVRPILLPARNWTRKTALVGGQEVSGAAEIIAAAAGHGHTWEDIAAAMDSDIRERVHYAIAPCTNEEFLAEYLRQEPGWLDL